MFENGVTYQYIGNVTNGATDDTTLGQNIASGSIALVEVATNKVQETDQTSTAGMYKIVQKTAAGQLLVSPEFNLASKTTVSALSYVAPTEQVTYYGYNTSSGDLGTIVSGTTYVLHITLTSYAPGLSTSPLVKTIPFVATAATEQNVAQGLAQSFERVFGREPYKVIQCDLVCDEAGSALSATTGNLTVVNGSTAITAATDIDGEMSVGDLFRPSNATTGAVYEIVEFDTTNQIAVLDRPYTGTSGTLVSTTCDYITNANAATGSYGFKFTGLDRFDDSGFNPQNDFYSKVRFEVASSDFDASVAITESAVATEGVGTAYEVAQMESKYAMNDYAGRYQSAYPATVYRGEADLATPGTYDTIIIDAFKNEYVSRTTGQMPVSTFTLLLRLKVALAGDDVDTALGVTV